MSINNALRGMMMGLAVGDALGASVEFMEKDSFPPVTGYRDGGPHNLKAGYWTDDTSMALCTAVSLIQKNETDLAHQMQQYLRWYEKGYMSSTGTCFDIGNQTRRAIMLFKVGTPFSEACLQLQQTSSNAGNGALMRLAPIVIKFHDNTRAALEAAGLNAQLTHPDIRCVHANKVFTLLMLKAMQVKKKEQLIDLAEIKKRIKLLNREVSDVLTFDYLHADRKMIPNSGYVINSMKAALWAFFNSSDFKEGALLAVNLGGDSDTIGAIYGQLAGAFYGYDRIPREWIEQLHDYNTVNGYTDLLIEGITENDIDQLASSRCIALPSIQTR